AEDGIRDFHVTGVQTCALPILYNPFLPSWGEPYRKIVQRMNEVIGQVRKEAWGREAVCVSHQLPIWVTRRAAEQRRLWHRPDRQIGRASWRERGEVSEVAAAGK